MSLEKYERKRHFSRIPLLAVCLLLGVVGLARAQSDEETLRSLFFERSFLKAIQTYQQMSAESRKNPRSCYWIAQCYMRRHEFLAAEPLLHTALQGGLQPQLQARAQEILSRVEVLKTLCPPLYHEFHRGAAGCTVYARETAWAQSIAREIPRYLERAQQGFAQGVPPINFYLFDQRPEFEQFSIALTDVRRSTIRGTGLVNTVLFCRIFPDGRVIGESNPNQLFARVLHEYCHALCATNYGDGWDPPQWLNEGMADYFGWWYVPDSPGQLPARLRRLAARRAAPSYGQLCKQYYELTDFGYDVGDFMVSNLLSGMDVGAIGRIVETARSRNGDFEGAIQQVTGRDARAALQQAVDTYWLK